MIRNKLLDLKCGAELLLEPSQNERVNLLKEHSLKATEIALSMMPGFGPVVAPMFSHYVGKITNEVEARRYNSLLEELHVRLASLEVRCLENEKHACSSFLHDCERLSIESQLEKQGYIASVIAKQLSTEGNWSESDACLLWLQKTSALHLQVLNVCINAPKHQFNDKTSDECLVKFFNEKSCSAEIYMYSVTDNFQNYAPEIIRLIAADLKGMGLLELPTHDSFLNEYILKVSDAGKWFGSWVFKNV